jgi:hypothetical protein
MWAMGNQTIDFSLDVHHLFQEAVLFCSVARPFQLTGKPGKVPMKVLNRTSHPNSLHR